jgi:hypothetical protein
MSQASFHPERSLAKSAAILQTESKDLMSVGGATGDARNFRIVIRFYDEHDTEHIPGPTREAVTRCSLICKPLHPHEVVREPGSGERSSRK